jgi:hypothetical protein
LEYGRCYTRHLLDGIACDTDNPAGGCGGRGVERKQFLAVLGDPLRRLGSLGLAVIAEPIACVVDIGES